MSTIAVLGAGAWGTALALVLARQGQTVRLWGHHSAHIEALRHDKENRHYLPGFPFPKNLQCELELEEALSGADGVLLTVPSHAFRQVISQIKLYLTAEMALAWASKGLDPARHVLLSEVLKELLEPRGFAVLSGPSFAGEVAAGKPTAIALASTDEHNAQFWKNAFHQETFRVYASKDVIGTQLGGAIKNVLAIGTGIADGLKLGSNTQAALITRGLSEMMRLGLKLGAQPETFMGLAGMGDLILTCTDNQSRNRRFGRLIGEGDTITHAMKSIGQVVEGIQTTQHMYALAREHGIEVPITEQVFAVLYEKKSPQEAVKALLARKAREE